MPGLNLFVDTGIRSPAFRRDSPRSSAEVSALARALGAGEPVFTTGLVLQQLLQGFRGPRARDRIVERFAALPFLVPGRDDHVAAAALRNACRRRSVQVGTIDALLAQLCIRHDLTMLTTDTDFARLAEHEPLDLWRE